MESIRKIKKLFKRYPLVIELSLPTYISNEAIKLAIETLKEKYGDMIVMVFHKEPVKPFIPLGALSAEQKADFREKWEEAMSSGLREEHFRVDTAVSGGDKTAFSLIQYQDNFKIHSVFKLSAKQHKELLKAVKDCEKTILTK